MTARAYARATDPHTSWEAAESLTEDTVRASQQLVLSYIRNVGRAYSQWTGRDIVSTDALTKDEATHVIDRLDSWITDLVAAADENEGELVQGELIDEVQA